MGCNIQSIPTQSITLEDLQAFAKQRMAPYKVPTVLRVLEAIPRNAMGKINKKALVKELFG
jgi:acyl-CoA synthetase (AMP-forming)/AMP-acid ligase II